MALGLFSAKQDKPENISPLKMKIFGVIAVIIILCAAGLALFGKNKTNTNNAAAYTNNSNTTVGSAINASSALANVNRAATNNTVTAAAKTIDDTAVSFVSKQTGYCRALAPADWSFVSNAEATGADLFSPDQSLHAGWGISAVYTYMYPAAEDFLTAWLGYAFSGSFTSGGIVFGEEKKLDYDFVERSFTTSVGKRGEILYKVYTFGDPNSYVVSVYMADANNALWETQGATPSYVAISIRCVSQLRPTTSSLDVSSSDPSDNSDNPEVSLSDKWTEAIMGYENVYSPTTGEHYAAPLNSRWDGGPDGAGYYRSLPGGGYEKLTPGFGTY